MENFQKWLENWFDAGVSNVIATVVSCVIYIALIYIFLKLLNRLIIRLLLRSKKKELEKFKIVINSFFKIILVLFVLVVILDALNLNHILSTLLTAAGVSTLVVGLAANTLFSDLIAGISLILEGRIKFLDYVNINGVVGNVIEIKLKSVVLKNDSGEFVSFPSRMVTNFTNYSKMNIHLMQELVFPVSADVLNIEKELIAIANEFNNQFLNIFDFSAEAIVSNVVNTTVNVKLVCKWENSIFPQNNHLFKQFVYSNMKDKGLI